jgi:hypothetical protein
MVSGGRASPIERRLNTLAQPARISCRVWCSQTRRGQSRTTPHASIHRELGFTEFRRLHLRLRSVGSDEDYVLKENLHNHYVQISPSREAFSLEIFDHFRDHSRLVEFISNLGGGGQKALF